MSVRPETGNGVEIRPEAAADHATVAEVVRSAFGSPVQAGLVEALRGAAEPKLSLVAALEREVVGHIFLSPVTFESEPALPACQLSPVAVAPRHQARGIGSLLINAGLAGCPAQGWSSVFLVGNPLYYARFGFEMAARKGLACDGPHGPFLQCLELEPGALSGVTGHVLFHEAFTDIAEE